MSLPNQIFEPAFRHQRLSLFFAAIVGIMVYLATFAMAAEATLSAITFTWDKGMESRMTVEIPVLDDEASTPQAERVRQAISVLRAMPDVIAVTPVSDDAATALLKPWIAQPELLKSLPIPALIDIERKTGSTLTASNVEDQLRPTIRDAHVDDHATWLADISHIVQGLSLLAVVMVLLTGATLVVAVSLICRAIMATERETLSLLHILGAEDNDIARHFQFHARRLSLPASFIGFALAMLSAGVILFFLRHFADPMLLQPLHWIGLGFLTLLVPLLAVWIAAQSARFSTLKILHAMP
jgi:cell division transport system permease protein